MPKFDYNNHETMLQAGYAYEASSDKYFSRTLPSWDVTEKREAGIRQGAWPSASVDEFKTQEKEWIERQKAKIKLLKASVPSQDVAE